MQVPWKLKSKIFYLVELLSLDYFLKFIQKYITKRSYNLSITNAIKFHQNNIIDNNLKNETLMEIGAGRSMFQNIYLSNFVNKQILIDKYYLLDFNFVNYSINYFSRNGIKLKNEEKIIGIDDLEKFGIYYKAPADLYDMELESESINIFISTNTLEHIPKFELTKLFKEMFRLLKKNGLVSIKIDYKDHYSFTDKSISSLNYLYYSEEEWKKHNHKSHYQNRLRHFDYLEIFKSLGFSILIEDAIYRDKDIDPKLESLYSDKPPSWCATDGLFLLKKI